MIKDAVNQVCLLPTFLVNKDLKDRFSYIMHNDDNFLEKEFNFSQFQQYSNERINEIYENLRPIVSRYDIEIDGTEDEVKRELEEYRLIEMSKCLECDVDEFIDMYIDRVDSNFWLFNDYILVAKFEAAEDFSHMDGQLVSYTNHGSISKNTADRFKIAANQYLQYIANYLPDFGNMVVDKGMNLFMVSLQFGIPDIPLASIKLKIK